MKGRIKRAVSFFLALVLTLTSMTFSNEGTVTTYAEEPATATAEGSLMIEDWIEGDAFGYSDPANYARFSEGSRSIDPGTYTFAAAYKTETNGVASYTPITDAGVLYLRKGDDETSRTAIGYANDKTIEYSFGSDVSSTPDEGLNGNYRIYSFTAEELGTYYLDYIVDGNLLASLELNVELPMLAFYADNERSLANLIHGETDDTFYVGDSVWIMKDPSWTSATIQVDEGSGYTVASDGDAMNVTFTEAGQTNVFAKLIDSDNNQITSCGMNIHVQDKNQLLFTTQIYRDDDGNYCFGSDDAGNYSSFNDWFGCNLGSTQTYAVVLKSINDDGSVSYQDASGRLFVVAPDGSVTQSPYVEENTVLHYEGGSDEGLNIDYHICEFTPTQEGTYALEYRAEDGRVLASKSVTVNFPDGGFYKAAERSAANLISGSADYHAMKGESIYLIKSSDAVFSDPAIEDRDYYTWDLIDENTVKITFIKACQGFAINVNGTYENAEAGQWGAGIHGDIEDKYSLLFADWFDVSGNGYSFGEYQDGENHSYCYFNDYFGATCGDSRIIAVALKTIDDGNVTYSDAGDNLYITRLDVSDNEKLVPVATATYTFGTEDEDTPDPGLNGNYSVLTFELETDGKYVFEYSTDGGTTILASYTFEVGLPEVGFYTTKEKSGESLISSSKDHLYSQGDKIYLIKNEEWSFSDPVLEESDAYDYQVLDDNTVEITLKGSYEFWLHAEVVQSIDEYENVNGFGINFVPEKSLQIANWIEYDDENGQYVFPYFDAENYSRFDSAPENNSFTYGEMNFAVTLKENKEDGTVSYEKPASSELFLIHDGAEQVLDVSGNCEIVGTAEYLLGADESGINGLYTIYHITMHDLGDYRIEYRVDGETIASYGFTVRAYDAAFYTSKTGDVATQCGSTYFHGEKIYAVLHNGATFAEIPIQEMNEGGEILEAFSGAFTTKQLSDNVIEITFTDRWDFSNVGIKINYYVPDWEGEQGIGLEFFYKDPVNTGDLVMGYIREDNTPATDEYSVFKHICWESIGEGGPCLWLGYYKGDGEYEFIDDLVSWEGENPALKTGVKIYYQTDSTDSKKQVDLDKAYLDIEDWGTDINGFLFCKSGIYTLEIQNANNKKTQSLKFIVTAEDGYIFTNSLGKDVFHNYIYDEKSGETFQFFLPEYAQDPKVTVDTGYGYGESEETGYFTVTCNGEDLSRWVNYTDTSHTDSGMPMPDVLTLKMTDFAHGNFRLSVTFTDTDGYEHYIDTFFYDSAEGKTSEWNTLCNKYTFTGTLVSEYVYNTVTCGPDFYLDGQVVESGNSVADVIDALLEDIDLGAENSGYMFIQANQTDETQYVSIPDNDVYGIKGVLIFGMIPNLYADATTKIKLEGYTCDPSEDNAVRVVVDTSGGDNSYYINGHVCSDEETDIWNYEENWEDDDPTNNFTYHICIEDTNIKEVDSTDRFLGYFSGTFSEIENSLSEEEKEGYDAGKMLMIRDNMKEVSTENAKVKTLDEKWSYKSLRAFRTSVSYRVGFEGAYLPSNDEVAVNVYVDPSGSDPGNPDNYLILVYDEETGEFTQWSDVEFAMYTYYGRLCQFYIPAYALVCVLTDPVEKTGDFKLVSSGKYKFYEDDDLLENCKVQYGDDETTGIADDLTGFSAVLYNDVSGNSAAKVNKKGQYDPGSYYMFLKQDATGKLSSNSIKVEIVKTYYINYVIAGGSVPESAVTKFSTDPEMNATEIDPDDYKPSGSDEVAFDGWYSDARYQNKLTGEDTKIDITDADVRHDYTFYGRMIRNYLTVKYTTNGTTVKKTENIACTEWNENYTLSYTPPASNGQKFVGWTFEDDNGKTICLNDVSDGNEDGNIRVWFESGDSEKGEYYEIWSDQVFEVTGKTLILTPIYGDTEYQITYHLGDGEFTFDGTAVSGEDVTETRTYTYNAKKNQSLITPTREGYTFKGWVNASGKTVKQIAKKTAQDLELTAVWSINKYTITYKANGGSGKMAGTSYHTGDSFTTPVCKFKRTGYVFGGWQISDGRNYGANSTIGLTTGNLVFTAIWNLATYKITFDPCAGGDEVTGCPSYVTFTYDKKTGVTLKDITPERTGYVFKGWYTTAAYKKAFSSTRGLSAGTTVYAKWEPAEKTYQISEYSILDGDVSENITISGIKYAGSKKLAKNTFTKAGYQFMGWAVDREATEVVYADAATIPANCQYVTRTDSGYVLNLYAVWEKDWSITYNLNGGSLKGRVSSYTLGTGLETLPTPTRDGYTFAGWYTSPKFTAKTKVASIKTTQYGDITLYAKWTAKKYTVTFDANLPDGVTKSTGKTAKQTLTYGTAKALTKNGFKITGYQFVGWSTEEGAYEVEYTNAQKVTNLGYYEENVTLYAVWQPIDYTITYILSDDYGNKQTIKYTYTVENDYELLKQSLNGYNFTGWFLSSNLKKNPISQIKAHTTAKNLTVYGKLSMVQSN